MEFEAVTFDPLKYEYPSRRGVIYGAKGMVATSQNLAAEAGLDMLKKGGNAIDAAIATAIVLAVVEPMCNSIGSDSFALVWTGGKLHGLNASGPAPKLASREAVLAKGLKEIPEYGMVPMTIPGTVSGWVEMSEKFGKLPFEELLQPAINYAEEGFPVYLSKVACESDGIIVCNRVKPHTDFVAENESGLLKMITIGLGKQWGANFAHGNGLAQCVKSMAQVSLKNAPIIAGLAIVENALDHTYLLQAVKPENFVEEDARLLKIARGNVPQIPADELDLLVVKEIGKEYSGTGMDTKVIGRMRIYGEPEPLRPRIRTIVALRISPNSHGNATGIGLADLTTQALVDQIRKDTTYTNILATTFTERGKIPMHLDTEEETINYAFNIGNAAKPDIAKVAIVENTLHLGTMLVSKAVLDEHPELEILEENVPFTYDEQGMLITPISNH